MKGDEGMREIKFRIWDMDRKVMLGSRYVIFYDGDFYENYRDLEDGILIENIAVMQYTGLKDKDGAEIYEGDIIEFVPLETSINNRVVKFEKGVFKAELIRSGSSITLSNFQESEIKVIGNIYENPELLESKKD